MSAIAFFEQFGGDLLAALGFTVFICLTAVLVAVPLGFGLAMALRAAPIPRRFARAYVDVMRGTPVLVLLFLIYYGGPSIGLVFEAATVGIVGFSLYGAAYFAEIFRAGLNAVPAGQIEAARMLGFGDRHIATAIQIPQMLRLSIAPGINQAITLTKESAALSIITVPELTKTATEISNETFLVVLPYGGVALLYWGLIELMSLAGHAFERRQTASHGIG